jgi:hypothetical protein
MPYLLAAFLNYGAAIFFAVHAVKNRKERHWLMVIFVFPVLGSVVYFFAEYIRDFRYTSGGRRAVRLMQGVINPERELRFARQEFDRTPTAFNEAQLARALLAQGDIARAIEHYQRCTTGPYAQDLSFLKGLAIAQLEATQCAPAVVTLERLFEAHPEQKKGDLVLMYAEALAGANDARADPVFESVIKLDSSIEARCKYAQYLRNKGRVDAAKRIFEEVLQDADRGHNHSRELNREWIQASKTALKKMV